MLCRYFYSFEKKSCDIIPFVTQINALPFSKEKQEKQIALEFI